MAAPLAAPAIEFVGSGRTAVAAQLGCLLGVAAAPLTISEMILQRVLQTLV